MLKSGSLGKRGEPGAAEQAVERKPRRPGGVGLAHGLGQRRQQRAKRRGNGAERGEQLRHQHQSARELRRCLAELALRLQHDGEIVDGLGIVRLELDEPAVGARGIVEPPLLLRLRPLR